MEASARSSAVAEERTATSGLPMRFIGRQHAPSSASVSHHESVRHRQSRPQQGAQMHRLTAALGEIGGIRAAG